MIKATKLIGQYQGEKRKRNTEIGHPLQIRPSWWYKMKSYHDKGEE